MFNLTWLVRFCQDIAINGTACQHRDNVRLSRLRKFRLSQSYEAHSEPLQEDCIRHSIKLTASFIPTQANNRHIVTIRTLSYQEENQSFVDSHVSSQRDLIAIHMLTLVEKTQPKKWRIFFDQQSVQAKGKGIGSKK